MKDSCRVCKHIDKCKLAKQVKEQTGMKFGEMLFSCFETKG